MKASISIVVRDEEVHAGDTIDVFVHLHVFKTIKIREFRLELRCEEYTTRGETYLEPQPMLFMFNNRSMFQDLMPRTITRYEKTYKLEDERGFMPDDEKNYNVDILIPKNVGPSVVEGTFYRQWFLKATLDKPHALDINSHLAVNVLPPE